MAPYLRCSAFRAERRSRTRLEPIRVRRQRFAIVADVARQLRELRGQASRALGQSLRSRIQPGRIGESVRRAGQRVADRALARQGRLGLGRSLQEPFDVREPGLLRRQSLGLSLERLHRLDLAHLIREEVQLSLSLTGRGREGIERLPCVAPALPRVAVGGERDQMRVAGEPIEEAGLGRRRQQPLRLVLPVHLDQRRAEIGERGGSRELSADPGGALPVHAHGARQQDLAVLRPVGCVLGGIEARLDARGLRAGANERAVGPDAQRERQTDRHHRLAGPGLAREDVQTGMQVEIEVVDDPETADVQLPQHARSLSGAADIFDVHDALAVARSPGSSNLPRTRERNGGAPGRRTRRAGRSAAADRARLPTGSSTLSRPSAESRPGSSPTTSSTTCCCAPRTNDRSNTMCAAMGVNTRHGTSGSRSARGPRTNTRSNPSASRRPPRRRRSGDVLPVDLDREPDQPVPRSLLDDHLVQRPLGSELGATFRTRGGGDRSSMVARPASASRMRSRASAAPPPSGTPAVRPSPPGRDGRAPPRRGLEGTCRRPRS